MQSASSSGVEAPAVIGQKYLRTLDSLSRIDPILSGWTIWESHCTLDELVDWVERGSPEPALIRAVAIDDARKNMAALVETNVQLNDWGEERPNEGYSLTASNLHNQTSRGVNVSVHAGSRFDGNRWSLNFGADGSSPPDPALLTLPIMGGIFRTMTSIWPTPWALLRGTTSEREERPSGLGFGQASVETFRHDITWMGYLSARAAIGIEPAGLTAERAADGGIVLTAFRDPPDPTNAAQMRRSDLLGAIMDKAYPRT
jgi:hypothetical protein